MWFGNVLLIFGIIGVAFSGIYIQAIMFVKITTKQSHDCYFVFLNNYHIKNVFFKNNSKCIFFFTDDCRFGSGNFKGNK